MEWIEEEYEKIDPLDFDPQRGRIPSLYHAKGSNVAILLKCSNSFHQMYSRMPTIRDHSLIDSLGRLLGRHPVLLLCILCSAAIGVPIWVRSTRTPTVDLNQSGPTTTSPTATSPTAIPTSTPTTLASSSPRDSAARSAAPVPLNSLATGYQLAITITGFDSEEGDCLVALYTDPKGFNDPVAAYAKQPLAIQHGTASWTLSIPDSAFPTMPRRMAVCAFHDANRNGRLDKNALGIPIERYGFSRNPKRGFGPPKFADVALGLDLDSNDRDQRLEPSSIAVDIAIH